MTLYLFTPTYNRANYLDKLYLSLCRQTNKHFVWLVVDDGSTDGTRCLIQSFMAENKITIQYIYKENGGKHTAYNMALELMNGKGYHVCVDSDDYLVDEAVAEFYNGLDVLETMRETHNIIGLVYPKRFSSKKLEWLPTSVKQIHIPDFQFQYRLSIETTIVIDNHYTRSFRFATFPGETFLSEETLYYYLAQFGYFYPIKAEVYHADYLPTGLTAHLFTLWQKNYCGTLHSLQARYEYVSTCLSGMAKWRSILACQLNRQALTLTRHTLIDVLKMEQYPILLPLSYIWKLIRFKPYRNGGNL